MTAATGATPPVGGNQAERGRRGRRLGGRGRGGAGGNAPDRRAEQTKAVQRINAYFNNITNLQGSFEQVDSTNKRTTGRFYVQRPGKIRFDYAPPSGLAHHRRRTFPGDRGCRPQDGREISRSNRRPFRLLLTDAVDLDRDARIVGVESQEGTLRISLEDKSNGRRGQHQAVLRERDRTPAESSG